MSNDQDAAEGYVFRGGVTGGRSALVIGALVIYRSAVV